MEYRIHLTNELKERAAQALLLELLMKQGGGHWIVGEQGVYLVPPDDAPDSPWFAEGPAYPEKYATVADVIGDDVVLGLRDWLAERVATALAWVMAEMPEEVTVEQATPRKKALVTKRNGEACDNNEMQAKRKRKQDWFY